MLYITTNKNIGINIKWNRRYTINENTLNQLINKENDFPSLIASDENRDNEFINNYNIIVNFSNTTELKCGDKLIVVDNQNIQMTIFN